MGDDGASVGEDALLDDGTLAGSKSRSGMGGDNTGLCVRRSRRKRRRALSEFVSRRFYSITKNEILGKF